MKKLILAVSSLFILPSVSLGQSSAGDIRRVVRNHLHEIKDCYEEFLAKKDLTGERSGSVVVAWDFNGQGKVTQAKVREDKTTLKNTELHNCILGRIKTWEFPKPSEGKTVSVEAYPFAFNQIDKKK